MTPRHLFVIMVQLVARALAIGAMVGAVVFSMAILATPAHGQPCCDVQVVPKAHRVVDKTYTLTPDQVETLATKLKTISETSGVVIGVLLVDTTQPEAIFDYSQRTFDEWKLGGKGKDNGVLIVVAKKDRKVRLHTGYGTEGAIPDAIAKRITDGMAKNFKTGNFYGGLNFAVDEVAKRMKKEIETASATVAADPVSAGNELKVLLIFFIFFGIGICIILYILHLKRAKEEARQARQQREAEERSYRQKYKPSYTSAATPARKQTYEKPAKRRKDDDDVIVPIIVATEMYRAPEPSYTPPSDNSYTPSESGGGYSGGGGSESSWDSSND